MVGSGTPRANSSKLKLALWGQDRRKPLEIQGFNAKSREHSLSAFCVNWLTGSFRAKNLSSPSATLFVTILSLPGRRKVFYRMNLRSSRPVRSRFENPSSNW